MANKRRMKIDGLPVLDATKKVVISIGNSDIKNGNSKDPAGCAAARACVRQLQGVEQARVHLGRIYLKIGKRWLRYQTPDAIRSEVIAFDRGGSFEPGDYVIAPMCLAHRSTDRHLNKNRPAGKKRKGESLPYHTVTGVRAHANTGR